MGKLPQRKTIRLKEYDYNTPGVYFLTMCTENRRCILSRIVGTGVLDGPKIELLPCGEVVERILLQIGSFYKHILIEDFVIMPNHVHILLKITEDAAKENTISTAQNTAVSRFVSTLKRFTHREWGGGIWQPRSYDHVIRDQDDFEIHRKYIKENPSGWEKDELYSRE